jgi:hypothetical protein
MARVIEGRCARFRLTFGDSGRRHARAARTSVGIGGIEGPDRGFGAGARGVGDHLLQGLGGELEVGDAEVVRELAAGAWHAVAGDRRGRHERGHVDAQRRERREKRQGDRALVPHEFVHLWSPTRKTRLFGG